MFVVDFTHAGTRSVALHMNKIHGNHVVCLKLCLGALGMILFVRAGYVLKLCEMHVKDMGR